MEDKKKKKEDKKKRETSQKVNSVTKNSQLAHFHIIPTYLARIMLVELELINFKIN